MRKRLEKNIKETVLPCYEVAHAEKIISLLLAK